MIPTIFHLNVPSPLCGTTQKVRPLPSSEKPILNIFLTNCLVTNFSLPNNQTKSLKTSMRTSLIIRTKLNLLSNLKIISTKLTSFATWTLVIKIYLKLYIYRKWSKIINNFSKHSEIFQFKMLSML